ncbi:condensation domain-containing protein, partial [Dactylosporangium darangshiense]|uniref:condensation domain-containing protein n=1 Tax=Dactylosporangium darangshiense TaxID=579108 RepID=UPI0031EFD8B6
YQAPTTPTEELLTHIWTELLHLDQIGITDNFFDLGGHSLLATQAITRTRTTFNTSVPTATLFDHPTIRELGAVIDTAAAAGSRIPSIARADRGGPLPLSFAQQRLWFLAKLDPGSTEYNAPEVLHFDDSLDPDALARALATIVDRHEILRTRLVTDADGTPHQVIDPPGQFSMDKIDVTGEPDPRA